MSSCAPTERGRLAGALTWPAPALLAWAVCWSAFVGLRAQGAPPALTAALAAGLGLVMATRASTPWRRVFVAAGFPLSLLASGLAGDVPPWLWLASLAVLVLLYPLKAWRDAPVFPTPAEALRGLGGIVPLPEGARILDAGCGFGDALLELRREYPSASLEGVEWSWPLRLACAWRCRFARIVQGDLWAADWAAHDLVYVFQRPESLARALAKGSAEMRTGSWLASLEFAAAGRLADRAFACADGRTLHLYRMPGVPGRRRR